jgi:hypothetical protein
MVGSPAPCCCVYTVARGWYVLCGGTTARRRGYIMLTEHTFTWDDGEDALMLDEESAHEGEAS